MLQLSQYVLFLPKFLLSNKPPSKSCIDLLLLHNWMNSVKYSLSKQAGFSTIFTETDQCGACDGSKSEQLSLSTTTFSISCGQVAYRCSLLQIKVHYTVKQILVKRVTTYKSLRYCITELHNTLYQQYLCNTQMAKSSWS